MQLQPALVARDVRLSPITLVVALPSGSTAGDIETSMSGGPVPAHALDEACNAARGMNADKLVSCGYVFMDSGDEIAVGTDNSMQVSLGCEYTPIPAPVFRVFHGIVGVQGTPISMPVPFHQSLRALTILCCTCVCMLVAGVVHSSGVA